MKVVFVFDVSFASAVGGVRPCALCWRLCSWVAMSVRSPGQGSQVFATGRASTAVCAGRICAALHSLVNGATCRIDFSRCPSPCFPSRDESFTHNPPCCGFSKKFNEDIRWRSKRRTTIYVVQIRSAELTDDIISFADGEGEAYRVSVSILSVSCDCKGGSAHMNAVVLQS